MKMMGANAGRRNTMTRPSPNASRAGLLAILFALSLALTAVPALAQQKVHEEYTKKIREFTTDPHFATPYVDYSALRRGRSHPLEVLGHIAGAQRRPLLHRRHLQVHAGPGRRHAPGQGLRHRQDRGGPRLDRRRHRRRGRPSATSTNTRRSTPSLADPRKLSDAEAQVPPRPSQADLLGHRRPRTPARPARPRCSWSSPTASPSTSRPSSRPSARTPSRSSPPSSSPTAATSRSTWPWPSARTPRPTSPTGSSTGASTSRTTTTATTSAWPSSSASTS
ncbi:MAG: hypothetical protein MZV63_65305 [Marinilabiliales bacterium]|nr:hypothetical protein [Marinilabiliales bacterium]